MIACGIPDIPRWREVDTGNAPSLPGALALYLFHLAKQSPTQGQQRFPSSPQASFRTPAQRSRHDIPEPKGRAWRHLTVQLPPLFLVCSSLFASQNTSSETPIAKSVAHHRAPSCGQTCRALLWIMSVSVEMQRAVRKWKHKQASCPRWLFS